jgi:capsular exopolysaccharide synthesis family protein
MLRFREKGKGEDGRAPASQAPPAEAAGVAAPKGVPRVVGVPLGSIIPRRLTDDPTLVVWQAPRSPLAERYRGLVHRVFPDHADRPNRIITVTSSAPDEGKTTTCINLCLALAERKDHATLLIDADMRRPSIQRYITPEPTVGLSDVLQGEAGLDHALMQLKDVGLTILPAGTLVPNPQELLRSQFVSALFAELRKRFDQVVIDTPPVVPFTDASILNNLADGALLVIRAGRTPRPMVERAVGSLSQKGVLGVVLNGIQITAVDRYYYRYDEYNPYAYAADDQEKR